jgi:glycosyltransferase involved in cell wall biosynthesis
MCKRIKIIFFIDSFRVGGMHKQVYLLINNLDLDRFEPIIVTQSQSGGQREQFLNLKCEKYDLGWKSRLSFFNILIKFIKVLRNEKPDIIFITQLPNFIYFQIARIFISLKITLIGSFRAMNFWLGHKGFIYLFFENIMVKYFYRCCDFVTANSSALINHYYSIVKIHKLKPISLIYNGIDFNNKDYKSTKSELFNILDSDIIIIMLARLDSMKDFDTLLKAAQIVCKQNTSIKFFLIGDGELKESIKNQIIELELSYNLFLTGEVIEPSEYLRFADISVLSTKGEGLSNTLLESMNIGIPCIATSIGGNIELLEDGRGILVDKKDELALSNAIIELANNDVLRTKLKSISKSYLEKNFSISNMVKKYQKLFSLASK